MGWIGGGEGKGLGGEGLTELSGGVAGTHDAGGNGFLEDGGIADTGDVGEGDV